MNGEQIHVIDQCLSAGISFADTLKLRRIAATLRRWYELECGTEHGCIQRDDNDGIPYWVDATTGQRTHRVPDRETGALKRLEAIMAGYPDVHYILQSDPRGPALYLHHNDREIAVY